LSNQLQFFWHPEQLLFTLKKGWSISSATLWSIWSATGGQFKTLAYGQFERFFQTAQLSNLFSKFFEQVDPTCQHVPETAK
jgi:hypothetical protein